jgi:hypothetical protein
LVRLKRNVRNAEIVANYVTDREQGDHMTSTGRVARLTALALATGTLVAAGASTASAATAEKTNFTASGGGSVIRLTVNLPSQLDPVLGAAGLPATLTQDLVLTGGTIRTSDLKSIATSTLGANGNVPALSALLDKSVTAEYGKPAPAPFTVLPQSVKDGLAGFGIHVRALELNSAAGNPAVDGAVSHSLSTVADLTIDGTDDLNQILAALSAQIQSLLATALGTATQSQADSIGAAVPTATAPVTTLLGKLTDTLDAATNDATKPLTDAEKAAVNTVLGQLTNLPNLLTSTLKVESTDTSLLHVGLIESEQSVARAAGVVTSTSANKLVGVSALMGLVTVDGLTSQATAKLGNGVSKATADKGQNALLNVGVKGLLTAELGNDLGVTLTGLPAELQTTVQSALNEITSTLNSVLGVTLTQTKVGSLVQTPNHAASSVAAARLVVNPTLLGTPLFAKPILDIQFVPAAADVVKAQANTPPAVLTPGKAGSAPIFAPTGANFALTGPIAISLMGLALVARRRRLANLAG